MVRCTPTGMGNEAGAAGRALAQVRRSWRFFGGSSDRLTWMLTWFRRGCRRRKTKHAAGHASIKHAPNDVQGMCARVLTWRGGPGERKLTVRIVLQPQQWTAPLSRELLIFNSFLKTMGRSMRSLVEMIAMSMLLRGDAKRSRDDYLDISLSLPFQNDANTGLGIVVKCYLDALLTFHGGPVTEADANSEEVREAQESVLGMLEGTFENVKDVRAELARGFRFWDAVSAISASSLFRCFCAHDLTSLRVQLHPPHTHSSWSRSKRSRRKTRSHQRPHATLSSQTAG